jgi:hypothetical protein
MAKRNNTIRYVVKNNEGNYVNSYSTELGDNLAFKYAKECARLTKGIVWSQDKERKERKVHDNSK